MIYILLIWTVVGAGASSKSADVIKYDWRPLGEFQSTSHTSKALCEDAARQLGLKSENYRCVRSK
jgi:hypothetical protein